MLASSVSVGVAWSIEKATSMHLARRAAPSSRIGCPGHDLRHAIDAERIERELGWRPSESFESGLRKTVQWYLDKRTWVSEIISGEYRTWIDTNYTQRDWAR